jgi:hypothetical protein
MSAENGQLAGDLLEGAAKIAEFIYGDPAQRRKVYAHHERGDLPIFKIGEILHARKSALWKAIEAKEAAATSSGEAA